MINDKGLRYFCDCMRGKLTRIMHDNIEGYLDKTLNNSITVDERIKARDVIKKALKAHLRAEFME